MHTRQTSIFLFTLIILLVMQISVQAAYHHMGEIDSDFFLAVYPQKIGTKLDNCALCHSGGEIIRGGKAQAVGSCQWCHHVYGYDGSGDLNATLNTYGFDYNVNGRSEEAVRAIEEQDSDGDGYTNLIEIQGNSFPGNAGDDPTKRPAPARIFSLNELRSMGKHTQFMLMNTHKSGDFYAEYAGVTVEGLLSQAGMLDAATSVTVFSPDGFSQTHPLDGEGLSNELYPVRKEYPQAIFYYNEQADMANGGWCSYSAPSAQGRVHGDPIEVTGGLKLLLAYEREGELLTPGVLGLDNRLNGEGPFRLVPPQVVVNPPDNHSTASNQDVIWPFTDPWDHNAGFSSRTTTIVRVEPLPEGTTDVDLMEAGWNYADTAKILVYGAIDPGRTVFAHQEGQIHCAVESGMLTNAEILEMDDPRLPQDGRPAGRTFPYGALKFDITGIEEGATILVTLTFPETVPRNATYHKVNASGQWSQIPIQSRSGQTITIALTDGDQATDSDGLVNGEIADPGVLAVPGGNSSGCVMSPNAVFSLEWILLIIPVIYSLIPRKRKPGTS
jgi:hypothetical protein